VRYSFSERVRFAAQVTNPLQRGLQGKIYSDMDKIMGDYEQAEVHSNPTGYCRTRESEDASIKA
jgi:hypothetical protein